MSEERKGSQPSELSSSISFERASSMTSPSRDIFSDPQKLYEQIHIPARVVEDKGGASTLVESLLTRLGELDLVLPPLPSELTNSIKTHMFFSRGTEVPPL